MRIKDSEEILKEEVPDGDGGWEDTYISWGTASCQKSQEREQV